MPVDFKANQIRTSQIIASGTNASNASILVYNVSAATNDAGSYVPSLRTTVGTDAFLFVSGSISSKKVGNSRGTTLFGGDVVASGSVVVERGLSGSLTQLWDGRSYLVAGSNVTITSASNGQVVISSTGGGGGGGGSSYFTDPTAGKLNTTGSLSLAGTLGSSHTTTNIGVDVFLFTSGSRGGKDSATPTTSVFGGDVFISGSSYLGTNTSDRFVVNAYLGSNIIPDGDRTRNLGADNARFANVYTGDLHLRNERGDWTIVEEEEYLCVVNNKSGKRYKMMLQPLD